MPPLIAAVLLGAGAYAGVKALQRVVSRALDNRPSASAPPSAAATSSERDLGHLELDPATGIYQPVTPLRQNPSRSA